MPPLTLSVIADEHQALAAMLRSLSMLVARSRRDQSTPPFEAMRAMLFYIDEFPERLHHPKESQLLFPKLRARVPALGPVLDRLDDDHARGEAAVREVGHRMLAFEVMGETRRSAFEEAIEAYIEGYLKHMALEETEVLPAARKHLSAADWKELDAAFAANQDPLVNHGAANGSDVYAPLVRKILNLAPAPVGLG